MGTSSPIRFPELNDEGTEVGYYNAPQGQNQGFMVSGGTLTTINYPGATDTELQGINNLGDIVGSYQEGSESNGFLLSNGQYTILQYPGAVSTIPVGINDAGVIVGRYFDTSFASNGFIYMNGQFTQVDYPGASDTGLDGINKQGVIAGGYSNGQGGGGGFLYQNGQFTNVVIPKQSIGIPNLNSKGDITAATISSNGTAGEGLLGTGCHYVK